MKPGVLHLIDTLEPGGAERVALNLSVGLDPSRWRAYLGTTRREGPLAREVPGTVGRLRLERSGRFDLAALGRLRHFIATERIDLVHAHTTSVFLAVAAFLGRRRRPRIVWHDHFGRFDTEPRPAWLYRRIARRVDAVIAVNPKLADWSSSILGVPESRVAYVPNFVVPATAAPASDPMSAPEPMSAPDLPPADGPRIVCVANFRDQKNHIGLLAAMERLLTGHRAQLLLVGAGGEGSTRPKVEREIARRGLGDDVHVLGMRTDVPAVLAAADIGVLASRSEGLPLALLEYGHAGLATVATDVGQCREVLDDGRAGLVVPAGDRPEHIEALGDALGRLVDDVALRETLADRLQSRVRARYSPESAMRQIEDIYRAVLSAPTTAARRDA